MIRQSGVRHIVLLPVFFFAAHLRAQDLLTRGAEIYNRTCATGYCHGLKGAASGAPRLVARGFDEAYITQVVRAGIPGTAMPAFGATLPRPEMTAVIAYVCNLNGVTPSLNLAADRGPAQRSLPPEAMRGRALFYDAVRGFGRCSTCHMVDGMGIAVTDPMTRLPESPAALRSLATPKVVTATADGDSFPALVLSKGGIQTKLYDLTSPPPVLRTFPSTAVKLQDGSAWRHASVLGPYSDSDLEAILTFLRSVVRP